MACFSARRASSCNTRRLSLNGCSVGPSCCFTGRSPSSSPACQEIPWRCWQEEGPWDLLGENTRWMRWEDPAHTRSHTHTNLKTCPYCSPLARLDVDPLRTVNEFNYSFPATFVRSFGTNQARAVSSFINHTGEDLQPLWRAPRVWRQHQSSVSQKNMLHFAHCTSVKPNFFF